MTGKTIYPGLLTSRRYGIHDATGVYEVEIEVSHGAVALLVAKARQNKTQKTRLGPVSVKVTQPRGGGLKRGGGR